MSQQQPIATAAVAAIDRKEQPCPRVADLINPYLRWVILRRYIPVIVDECPLREYVPNTAVGEGKQADHSPLLPDCATLVSPCPNDAVVVPSLVAALRLLLRGLAADGILNRKSLHLCSSNPSQLGWGTDSGSLLQLECSAAAHRRQSHMTTTAASTGYLPTWLRGVRVGGRPLQLRR